jgi:hypothetical protein
MTLSSVGSHRQLADEDEAPQTNGICERFDETLLNEFYRLVSRKPLYTAFAPIQRDLDRFSRVQRAAPALGTLVHGKTPLQTFFVTVWH